jgi:hypothetical protein
LVRWFEDAEGFLNRFVSGEIHAVGEVAGSLQQREQAAGVDDPDRLVDLAGAGDRLAAAFADWGGRGHRSSFHRPVTALKLASSAFSDFKTP